VKVAAFSSFHAPNVPGEQKDFTGIEHLVQMGRDTVDSFNKLFAA
jgi:hypothetical protein